MNNLEHLLYKNSLTENNKNFYKVHFTMYIPTIMGYYLLFISEQYYYALLRYRHNITYYYLNTFRSVKTSF